MSATEQIAQLSHGVLQVADTRFDGDGETHVARADVVAAGDMEQPVEADASKRKGLARVAVFPQVVGGAHRRNPLGAHLIAVAGRQNVAVKDAVIRFNRLQSDVDAASLTALAQHADIPHLRRLGIVIVDGVGQERRALADVPGVSRRNQSPRSAEIVSTGIGKVRRFQIERHPIANPLMIGGPKLRLQSLTDRKPHHFLIVNEFVIRGSHVKAGARAERVEPRVDGERQNAAVGVFD
jgi:hypothetical protein